MHHGEQGAGVWDIYSPPHVSDEAVGDYLIVGLALLVGPFLGFGEDAVEVVEVFDHYGDALVVEGVGGGGHGGVLW